MVGIIGNGGLRSLYAGWGAVLCRNVPHSIIKVRYSYMLDGFMDLVGGLSRHEATHTYTHSDNGLDRDLAIIYKCYSKLPMFIV